MVDRVLYYSTTSEILKHQNSV